MNDAADVIAALFSCQSDGMHCWWLHNSLAKMPVYNKLTEYGRVH